MKAIAQHENGSGRPGFRFRFLSWCKCRPEILIGAIGGLIIAALVPSFAEESTRRVIVRWLSKLAHAFHDLDVGLH
jgi:hypothetical protein